MTLWQKIKSFFRHMIGKDLPNVYDSYEQIEAELSSKPDIPRVTDSRLIEDSVFKTKEELERERWLPEPPKLRPRTKRLPSHKPSSSPVHHDISKFMKGKSKGHHRWYRRSTRARIQPEED